MRKPVHNAARKLDKGFHDRLHVKNISLPNGPWSRFDLIDVLSVGNTNAAVRLSTTLKKLDIATAYQLFRTDPFSLARIRGVGMAQLYVAMALLDNANYSVYEWWRWDRVSQQRTFATYKHSKVQRAKRRGTVDA